MKDEKTQRARRRAGLFAFFIAAQVLLVGAIWQYHQVLVTVYDTAVGDFFSSLGRTNASQEDVSLKPLRALVYISAATDRYNKANGHQRNLAERWVVFLESEGFSARSTDTWPAPERLARYNVLIMPAVSCMGDAEISQVKAFAEAGNGVVLTWAAGVQDEEGNWRERSLLAHMAGVVIRDPPPAIEEDYAALTLSSQSPLANGSPPGYVLRIRRYDPPVACRALEPRSIQAGSWVEEHVFKTEPSSILSFLDQSSALLHGSYGMGRFVWMGFTIISEDTEPHHASAFRELIRNAVLWAGRQPQAVKPSWPDNAPSAFTLSVEARTPDDLDPRLLALIRKHRVPMTVYASPSVMTDPSVQGLLRQADLEWDVLGMENDDVEDTASLREHVARLKDIRHTWETKTNNKQLGYRAMAGQASEGMMDALVRAGFRFITVTDSDRAIPHIVRSYRPVPLVTRARELWMLPQQTEKMADIITNEVPVTSYTMRERFEGIHAIGGYYHLYLPSNWSDEHAWSELDELLALVKQRHAWIATAGQVANHARLWGNITMTASYPSSNRISLQISNSGLETVKNAEFYLDFQEPRRDLEIKPLTLGSPQLITSTRDGLRWTLLLNSIPPGKNYAYHVENIQ